MKPTEIKILLIRAGITQADISREIGVSRSFINQIIKGQRHTKRARMVIAKAVGRRVEELWPSRSFKKAA